MQTVRLFSDVETPDEKHERARSGPDGLKPFLLDPDRHVREYVARYFSESYSQDSNLLGLVLDGCEEFGNADNAMVLTEASCFALSHDDFLRAIEHLSEAEDYNVCAHYGWILANAPAEWLVEQKDRLADTGKLTEGPMNSINWRFTYMDVSPQEAWDELRDYSEDSSDSQNVGDVDQAKADCLLDILAGSDVPEDERVLELLQDDDVQEEWLEVWLVKLAGLRQLSTAVPHLVKCLQLDTGYFRERVVDALVRIGDVEAVRQIDATFAGDPRHVKGYAVDVAARIKSDVSEEFLLDHLEREENVTVRTYLCDGLCRQCFVRGVEKVRQEIHRGYDRGMFCLEEDLLDVTDVLGIDLPEASEWRKEREERETRQRERREELNRLAQMAQAADNMPEVKREPVKKSEKKVGRNDPCPCGSGRKYKKCCGDPRKNR